MYPVRIAGCAVMLREVTEADAIPLHKVYGNEEATRHLSFEPRTMEQVEDIIKAAMASATADPRTEYMLAVAGKDEELIGSARLATGSTGAPRSVSRSVPTSGARARAWRPSGSSSASASPNWACTGSGERAARSTMHRPGPCRRPG